MVICLTDPRRKYHVKILAVSQAGDGYQTDQTISTPGCLCKCSVSWVHTTSLKATPELRHNKEVHAVCHLSAARDQLAASPPSPDHVTISAGNSSAVSLRWSRPAFPSGKAVSYTVRCSPVGTHNASAIRYIQT